MLTWLWSEPVMWAWHIGFSIWQEQQGESLIPSWHVGALRFTQTAVSSCHLQLLRVHCGCFLLYYFTVLSFQIWSARFTVFLLCDWLLFEYAVLQCWGRNYSQEMYCKASPSHYKCCLVSLWPDTEMQLLEEEIYLDWLWCWFYHHEQLGAHPLINLEKIK